MTADLRRLHGMIAGFLADGKLTDGEIHALADWLEGRVHMRGTWPYDEIHAVLTEVLHDGVIEPSERAELADFLAAHIPRHDRAVIGLEGLDVCALTLSGVCAANVDIQIPRKKFCFTGKSVRMERPAIHRLIEAVGGTCSERVVRDLNYLIVGADNNPCWAFAAYGRKVEKAMQLRKDAGLKILIIQERDFWDVMAAHPN